jgi:tetratricopeptide (TPR) repeat protein
LIIEGRDAVITVKGTVFTVMDKGQSTLIRVNEGEILVRDPTGSNAVPLGAGQMMEAIRGQPLVAKAGDRNKAQALKNKGIGLRDSGRLQEAEQELREAMVWYPEPAHSPAFLFLHLAQYERGDLGGCIATLEECQRRGVNDKHRGYAEVMLHLCELRLGRTTDRLAKYRNGYVGDTWPAPVMDMFLGTISPEAMLAKAKGDGEKSSAYYYAGEWYLHKGDMVQARRYFEESSRMKTGWTEPTTAGYRLKQLDLRP